MSHPDDRYPAETHAVLRYAPALLPDSLYEIVKEVSIREGFRLQQMEPYRGVELYLLDETTGMHTATYKALDGCITTAIARQKGYSRITCSSGANCGRALAEYGRRAGIETFLFCPGTTLYKLPAELFDGRSNHLIAIEGSDRRVKGAAKFFADATGSPLVPELDWRILASGVRGRFIAEVIHMRGKSFDWFAQAICAGFGPIGLYKALRSAGAQLNGHRPPQFLGVQQAALSPIADAWSRGDDQLEQPAQWQKDGVIEPSLYNTMPGQTYPLLHDILKEVGGDVITVRHQEYSDYVGEYLRRVEATGIRMTRRKNGEPLEKAGLLAGAGVLKAIDDGQIHAGQSVLCSLTGGTAPAPAGEINPEFRVTIDDDMETRLAEYARKYVHAD